MRCTVDSLCRAVRDLNMTSGINAGKEAPVQREKKLVNSYVVKSGMLRFNFMLDCCNPGTLPDAHLIAALLDLVSGSIRLSVSDRGKFKGCATAVGICQIPTAVAVLTK